MLYIMRDERRMKQARSNKQQGKATQYTQGSHFSYIYTLYIYIIKMSCLRWDSNPRVYVYGLYINGGHRYSIYDVYMD